MTLHQFGLRTLYLGVILSVVGLAVGFTAMIFYPGHYLVNAIGLIPIGFIALMAGTVGVMMGRPDSSHHRDMPD